MTLGGPRRIILAGACVAVAGLAIAGTAPIVGVGAADRIREQQSIGGVLVLAGWVALAWGIHRFGRETDTD
jgi:hypothetical protein